MTSDTPNAPATGDTPPETLDEALAVLAARRPLDPAAVEAARTRQGRLTKPLGSLGLLEDISVQLAGLSGQCPPPIPSPAVVAVFAADHGVQVHGVSPWPQEVTAQMIGNFLAGGAAVNALAGSVGARVVVVDVGVATPLDDAPGLLAMRVRDGSRDLSAEAAMTGAEVRAALDAGVAVAARLIREGYRCLLTGDMGIANTTASAALIAAFTGADPERVTGRGTGVDDDVLRLKIGLIRAGLALHADAIAHRDTDPIAVLAAVGGLEHAAIAGFVIGAAAARVPVILDGVIAGSAALAAAAIAPTAKDACIAGHCSAEPGHRIALEALGMSPLIDLGLRLGEGTGAVLALPIVRAAVAALRDMATFDSAGVNDEGLTTVLAPDGQD
ncbi:MAG: nicotinate-nucleotide--dimethylbenzimidazole phosphoribosyltransferase [Actinomycetota bacterium]|nr:nicotinate-nucleotide--dimethylbenzimidazole phosphoribosyltransferase [Actinomycetota bacterium]